MSIFSTKASTEEESCFPSLSFKERIIGFSVCTVLGWAMSLLSFGTIAGNLEIII